MKCKLKWLGGWSLLLLGLLVAVGHPTQAASVAQNADFSIQPVFDQNQTNRNLNYFNLRFKPGTTHEITLQVQNYTERTITIHSQFRNAITGFGGADAFTASDNHLDPSLKIPLTKLVQLQGSATIKLKPEETRFVRATVKMPANQYRGMIYGDWYFIENMKGNKNDRSSVASNYAYSMGLILQGSPYHVYPEIKYAKTEPILYHSHPALGVKLRNTQPMVLNNVSINASVEKKGLFASKYTYQAANRVINPNSSVTLPVSWAYDQLKPGTYTVHAKIIGQNYWNHLPMTWTINQKFTVKASQANTINQKALKKPVNQWIWIASATGVLWLLALVAWLRLLRLKG
ncbi:DUF3324 domain-containing protein [Lactobacillus curvatus]|nr:DUF3324 domain-containing protein [Latilactobacillus curvatus]MSE24658.1 DUF3324 domain-containing protein [Latilactobacillus curvatus]